jgi:hypothetical protein
MLFIGIEISHKRARVGSKKGQKVSRIILIAPRTRVFSIPGCLSFLKLETGSFKAYDW